MSSNFIYFFVSRLSDQDISLKEFSMKNNTLCVLPESVKLKNQISSKVSLEAKNKAKSSHSKCTQKVHENWKPPAFYAIIEVDKSGIGCGKNGL